MGKCENKGSLRSRQALRDASSACLIGLEMENEPSRASVQYLLAEKSSVSEFLTAMKHRLYTMEPSLQCHPLCFMEDAGLRYSPRDSLPRLSPVSTQKAPG